MSGAAVVSDLFAVFEFGLKCCRRVRRVDLSEGDGRKPRFVKSETAMSVETTETETFAELSSIPILCLVPSFCTLMSMSIPVLLPLHLLPSPPSRSRIPRMAMSTSVLAT